MSALKLNTTNLSRRPSVTSVASFSRQLSSRSISSQISEFDAGMGGKYQLTRASWNSAREKVLKKPTRQSKTTKIPVPVVAIETLTVKPEIEEEPIVRETKRNDVKMVQQLIDEDPDCVTKSSAAGMTALHWAAKRGFYRIAEILVQAGANVNCRDMAHRTPLHLATKGGHLDVITMLVAEGAHPYIRTRADKTAIDFASSAQVKSYLDDQVVPMFKPVMIRAIMKFRSALKRCRQRHLEATRAAESTNAAAASDSASASTGTGTVNRGWRARKSTVDYSRSPKPNRARHSSMSMDSMPSFD
eukprot:GILK01002772.1.p1 GENE.GILK01002772.1~~GILK01002772.1.p1  ORF type:complete len:302 (+),score=30.02 GILK01002772.1:31-936(+)